MLRLTMFHLLPLALLAELAIAQIQAAPPQNAQQLRLDLQNNPRDTVDRLNSTEMSRLLTARQYGAIEELAVAGTLALPADTWRIEQLQKYRVLALLAEHKP